MRFDLTDLKLFRETAEGGSITEGAAKLGIALAAASARIRNMEASLGAALLERSRRGVAPTAAGLTLLTHARIVLDGAERLNEAMGAFAEGRIGEVRLLANTNASTEFLPQALSRFLAAHPGVSVALEERLSDEIVGLIAEGAGDIGIAAGTVDFGALETHPFRTDRFVAVAARDHPLSGRASARFSELLDQDFVGLERSSALQRFLADKAAREGGRLRLRVQMRSFDSVCRLVEAGVGIGVAPRTTAARAARTMALAVIELEDAWAVRELTLCFRSLETLRPAARALAESLMGAAP